MGLDDELHTVRCGYDQVEFGTDCTCGHGAHTREGAPMHARVLRHDVPVDDAPHRIGGGRAAPSS